MGQGCLQEFLQELDSELDLEDEKKELVGWQQQAIPGGEFKKQLVDKEEMMEEQKRNWKSPSQGQDLMRGRIETQGKSLSKATTLLCWKVF